MIPFSNPLVVAGAALAIFAAGFGAGWVGNGWRLNAEIADIKTEQAEGRAIAADAAIVDLADAAKKINTAATDSQAIRADMRDELGLISKDLKGAISKIPLPDTCKPDTGRVRSLDAAIDSVNKAVAR